MLDKENIYQSILFKISAIPVDYLQQVDSYLQELTAKIEEEKEANRRRILSFAGGWSDMGKDDFEDYLKTAKNTSIIEDRNIEL